MPCDGFFEQNGVPFLAEFEDLAVYTVWSHDSDDNAYKKYLILCWFDTTFGGWTGSRFNLRDSRAKMSDFLAETPYSNFEQLLEAPTLEYVASRKRRNL